MEIRVASPVMMSLRSGNKDENIILIGYKSRSFSIFTKSMLTPGNPAQIPQRDVIISWMEHGYACIFLLFTDTRKLFKRFKIIHMLTAC